MKPCRRCGDCCSKFPCAIASMTIGDHRPCAALESVGDGTFSCGLMIHPSRYIDTGEEVEWKDQFLGGVFARMLGAGMGCCAGPQTESLSGILSEFHGEPVSYEDAVKFQMVEMGIWDAVKPLS